MSGAELQPEVGRSQPLVLGTIAARAVGLVLLWGGLALVADALWLLVGQEASPAGWTNYDAEGGPILHDSYYVTGSYSPTSALFLGASGALILIFSKPFGRLLSSRL